MALVYQQTKNGNMLLRLFIVHDIIIVKILGESDIVSFDMVCLKIRGDSCNVFFTFGSAV